MVQTFSELLPATRESLVHSSTASSSGPLELPPILAPNAERLGRWYGERLGRRRRWALIVEPHRKIAELIGYLLDFELGIQTVSVPRPRLAPALFRRWAPDLVVAEIPPGAGAPSPDDMAGLRPLLEVAQAQRTPLPIILCTTYIEVTPALAHSVGFAALIYKPFLPTTFVTTVRNVLANVAERPL